MWRWRPGLGAALAHHADLARFDNERMPAAAVVPIQHAGVDFHDTSIEALQYAPIAGRRVTDHDALRPDRVQ